MTKVGKCKLCEQQNDLQLSHAVGDSVFKKIFRKNSGKAISLSDGDYDIVYSCDSWAEYQLCKCCERYLNTEYEQYSLGVLRGNKAKVSKSQLGIYFSDVDLHKLNMYFLSIFWRAANSGHPSYRNAVMLEDDNNYLKEAIFQNKQVPLNRFSVKIHRVVDLSPEGGFTDHQLKDVILSPICRIHDNDKINRISICFMFEGFFIEIFMPGLKMKERNQYGVIHKSKSQLVVPYINIFDIPEMFELMVHNYGKYVEGKSRVKANEC